MIDLHSPEISINISQDSFQPDYASRRMDICGVCRSKYNVSDKIPRILISCGHTYCNSCLVNYYRNERVRCPFCKKLVYVESIEDLPMNYCIFWETIQTDPKLKALFEIKIENSVERVIYLVPCKKHKEKKTHFYCSFHEVIICRECIKPYHNGKKCCVVDLRDIYDIIELIEGNNQNNLLIVKARSKGKGHMKKEEFFIANNLSD